MINVAIVEDEKAAMEELQSYLERYARENAGGGVDFHSVWFDNPINFLTNYKASFDLILLDIDLPDMNGLETAHKMREIDKTVNLIFVTNMAQYAIKGYEVNADDFIVKPVVYFDFALKLDRILGKLKNRSEEKLLVKYDDESKLIPVTEIYYVEVMKHKLIYHTKGGVFQSRGPLKRIESVLTSNYFVKCNNYCLVNLRYVTGIKGFTLTVASASNTDKDDELLISHPRKKEFAKALNDYLGEQA